MITVRNVLSQIFNHFGTRAIPSMIAGYANIFLIMLLGFTIHWLPASLKEKYRGWFITTPIYAKVAIAVSVALLVFQVKSSVLQPFIYFQF